jgi:hypothetical protein
MKSIVLLSFLVGIVLILTTPQIVFAQRTGLDKMITQMRLHHNEMLGEIDEIKQSVKSNNTSEALTLLDEMDTKIDDMNKMFNDLIWESSNRGH